MNENFQRKAESYRPEILKKDIFPSASVEVVYNGEFYLDTQVVRVTEKEYYQSGDKICLDFGRHITGYFKFELKQHKQYIDAPVKLKIKFAETPYEMRRDFATYAPDPASVLTPVLCSAWLQEEIVTVDVKGMVSLPRRYAFRYVEIEVIATPQTIVLSNFVATACTSANAAKLPEIKVGKELKRIDEISVHTLSECMQDVFEDGPKRDRRLWIGDFRLEALTNYYTFQNFDIVKRCLYLFAAFDCEDRLLPSYVYTTPNLETGDAYLVSYALLFVVTLNEYFACSEDKKTVEELLDTARRQLEITEKMLDNNGILQMPEHYGWWTFIDWAELEPVTSTMGVYIYAVCAYSELCNRLGRNDESKRYAVLAENLKKASLEHLYNGSVFVNAYDRNQYSVHSQVWMILAGVVSQEDAQRILKECIHNAKYLSPVTPYMHHYVTEALVKAGMKEEAKQYILDYWGEMVKLGADTFWEAFVKDNPYVSPYGDVIMNSACHAWSCTPSYFIRKYDML